MKHLIKFAFWFGIGYVTATKLAPAVQAKFESMDLDEMWDIYSDVWGER